MDFAVLGPLEVRRDGEALALGGLKQRSVLALLLLSANEVVSRDRLIDELWGEEPPGSAKTLLQGHISELRKLLEPDRALGSPAQLLATRQPGYVLEIVPRSLDLHCFEELLAEGRRALAAGDAATASAVLTESLTLWRGRPLADLAYEPFAEVPVARLEELRLTAVEERICADLALSRHAELVPELEELVAENPLRERPRRQLMLALYRSGRQAEALDLYQETRKLLIAELGIEPGPALQELEFAILNQDPSLAVQATDGAVPGPSDLKKAPVVRAADFVGRAAELHRLSAALEVTVSGQGGIVLVTGEPGIGKTRIAREFSESASSRGVEVLWGRCYQRQGAPPYWPWVEAIRNYVGALNDDELRVELGTGGAVIAEIVPEIGERLPELMRPAPLSDPNQARFRLFDAVAAFLVRASERRPLAIVLDDLHWADSGSLLLLEFVSRELSEFGLLVIGTYRDLKLPRGHQLADTLAELSRAGISERIFLGGLSEPDVESLIELASGVAPPEGLRRAVYAKTDGNPFFVTEVVRLLDQEGELVGSEQDGGEAWTIRLPAGVRDVIGKRLNGLSLASRDVATVASAVGRVFAIEQLRSVCNELSESELSEALEEALAARLIDEVPELVGSYRFSHVLFQDTILEGLSVLQRRQLHAEIATALETLYGADAHDHASELAYHFAEAEPVLGSTSLARYSQLAGEQALAGHAYEEAAGYFRTVLDLIDALSERAGLERELIIETRLGYGHAHEQLGSFWEAQREYEEAVKAAWQVGDRGLEARALAALAHVYWREDRYEDGRRVLREAVDAARSVGATGLEATLLYTEGTFAYGHGDWERAITMHEEALRVSQASGDHEQEAYARHGLAETRFLVGPFEEGLAQARQSHEFAEELGHRPLLHENGYIRAGLAYLTGRFEEGLEAAVAALSGTREIGDQRNEAFASTLRGRFALAEGDLGAALERGGAAVDIAVRLEAPRAELIARSFGCFDVLSELHDFDRLVENLEVSRALSNRVGGTFLRPWLFSLEGWLQLRAEDELAANELFQEARALCGASIHDGFLAARLTLLALEERPRAQLVAWAADWLSETSGHSPVFHAWADYGHALTADLAREWELALQRVNALLAVAEHIVERRLEWRAQFLAVKALNGLGRADEASARQAEARRIVEEMAATLDPGDRSTFLARPDVAAIRSSVLDADLA